MVHRLPSQEANGDNGTVQPFSSFQWIIFISLAFLPDIVASVLAFCGITSNEHLGFLRWSRIACVSLLFWLSYRAGAGTMARLAARRMFSTTGTPMVLLALVPVLLGWLIAMIQLRGASNIFLDYNMFQAKHDNVSVTYSIGFWFRAWTSPFLSVVTDLWIVILILNCSREKSRIGLLGGFLAIQMVTGFLESFVVYRFFAAHTSHHLLVSSNFAWFMIGAIVWNLCNALIYLIFERKFRPSLLPVTILIASQGIMRFNFEHPTNAFLVASEGLGVVIVWLALRKSTFGIAKWSEYQQSHEKQLA